MKHVLCLLLCTVQLLTLKARAAESIGFVAEVQREGLAEEAILLLHCLAARSNTSWEFSGETRGSHWLKVTEKGGQLEGSYQREASRKSFTLIEGESDRACDELEPQPSGMRALEAGPSLSPALSSMEEELDSASSSNRTWLWVGIGAAAVASFFYWKSRQPRHRGIEMKD